MPCSALAARKKSDYEIMPSPKKTWDELGGGTDDNSIGSYRCWPEKYNLILQFWFLGVLNHSAYIIMLACAKDIVEGGTGLVFLANILPGLVIKSSAPYWFDAVPCKKRIQLATISMMTGCSLVALASHPSYSSGTTSSDVDNWRIPLLCLQLLGVAMANAQCSLGEASLLAFAGRLDAILDAKDALTAEAPVKRNRGQCLTALSSGTGMAGVFGFFWKWFWCTFMGFSLRTTLLLALSLGLTYWNLFVHIHVQSETPAIIVHTSSIPLVPMLEEQTISSDISTIIEQQDCYTGTGDYERIIPIPEMTGKQRFYLVLSLWRYMLPLFLVYAAEYALQSGTWTSIGFPVQDRASRTSFYQSANWTYFVGSFLSRSSGVFYTAPMWLLWTMPALQLGNLVVFTHVALHPSTSSLHQPFILYSGAFFAGLLGGSVYISGYKRICADICLPHREFALSSTSLAETLGIVIADIAGLVIQACLYQANGLADSAMMTCPL